ncbi:hypothetical protein BHE74_00036631 [Ensete ventricosum]|nr:hypothetical protein GW17_00050176 [Ensete ventricosum]RWW56640.1 hypothetical protein BHE74_00036631 [Ensete ventricosum]
MSSLPARRRRPWVAHEPSPPAGRPRAIFLLRREKDRGDTKVCRAAYRAVRIGPIEYRYTDHPYTGRDEDIASSSHVGMRRRLDSPLEDEALPRLPARGRDNALFSHWKRRRRLVFLLRDKLPPTVCTVYCSIPGIIPYRSDTGMPVRTDTANLPSDNS